MRDPHHDPLLPDGDGDQDAALVRQLFPLDDAAGPAPRRSAADLQGMINAALDAHAASGPLDPTAPAAPPRAPSLPPLGLALMAAALLLAAVTVLWLATGPAPRHPAPASDAVAGSASVAAPRPSSVPAPASAPAEASPPARAAEPASASDAAPASDSGPAPAAAAAPVSDPRDLLREANTLRGQGAFPAAERLYLRVVREHPRSSSAYVAKVAAASLRLERLNNPRGALTLFRSALRDNPSGSLAQEVRRGIALSTRRTGQRDAEQRALRDFIAHHGGTPFAATARARLSELDTASAAPAP